MQQMSMQRLGETISQVNELKGKQESLLRDMSRLQDHLRACYESIIITDFGSAEQTCDVIQSWEIPHDVSEVEHAFEKPALKHVSKSNVSELTVASVATTTCLSAVTYDLHAQIRERMDRDRDNACLTMVFEQLPQNKWTRCLQKCILWWMSLQEPERRSILHRIIYHKVFGYVSMFAILLNAVFSSVVASQQMLRTLGGLENDMGRDRRNTMISRIFAGIYAIELGLKLVNHRLYFFVNAEAKWNLFDAFLVVASLYEIAMEMTTLSGGTSLTFMRIGRLLKITKILRVLRSIRVLNQLKLMLASCFKSLAILFWCVLVLSFLWWALTLALMQALEPHIEAGVEQWKHDFIVEHFASFTSGMLLFLQLGTGGADWGDCYKVVSIAGPAYQSLFLLYIVFYAFGLFNILTGVVVENVMLECGKDEDTKDLELRIEKKQQAQLLQKLLVTIDRDGDGTLSEAEFYAAMSSTSAMHLFSMAGIDTGAAELFYRMLSNVGESVTVDVFLDSCLNMRGQAKAVDMQLLLCEVQGLRKKLQRVLDTTKKGQNLGHSNSTRLAELERKVCNKPRVRWHQL